MQAERRRIRHANVPVIIINPLPPPPPRSCFARGSPGAGSGARVAIINLWPCPGIVLPVVIVVLVVIVVVVVVIVVISSSSSSSSRSSSSTLCWLGSGSS